MQPTAVTAPNSAMPAYRKKLAVAADGTGRHAAGTIFVAPDGDILVLRRSFNEANFGGHWALPGGGVDAGESPIDAAKREAREEIGYDAEGPLKTLDRRVTPTGMTFHTFVRPVAEKFTPRLNSEHSAYAWTPINALPGPIHPAVESTLRERIGVAADMTPEDWDGLRDGFLKWSQEEEAEPEHVGVATDSAIALAMDRETVREVGKDGQLKVRVVNISKAAVNPYRGAEIPNSEMLGLDPDKVYYLLRDPEELRRAAPTFNGVQLLSEHVPVNAEDHRPNEIVGTTGTDAEFDGTYLKNSIFVWAKDAIDEIESGAKKEVSSGYHYRADMTPGIFGATRYDGVMRDIVGNHVALVKDGRAGPDVVIGDSTEGLMKPTRLANAALLITAAAVRPLLAKDAKVDLMPTFKAINSKNFDPKTIRLALDKALAGKLAKDTTLDSVNSLLDRLDGKKEGSDAELNDAEASAMQNAATLAAPPPDTTADNGMENMKGFLRSKGMGEDDINAACDMVMPKPATDESDKDEDEKKDDAAKDAADPDKDEKDSKDMSKDDPVSKPAMDAAIKVAAAETAKKVRAEVIAEQNAIRAAEIAVRPWVGNLAMAFDSAEQVYAKALEIQGVDVKGVHPSAYPALLNLCEKPGAKPTKRIAEDTGLGMDESSVGEFNKMFPGASRISLGG
jgi:8-oxo-dGTP pyrophosphatase MutT (NUDIX family)